VWREGGRWDSGGGGGGGGGNAKKQDRKIAPFSLHFISIMFENPGKGRGPSLLLCRCPW